MQPEITVFGLDDCLDTTRTRRYLNLADIPYTYINLDKDEDADRRIRAWNGGRRVTPTVIVSGSGQSVRLVEPDDTTLLNAIRKAETDSAA